MFKFRSSTWLFCNQAGIPPSNSIQEISKDIVPSVTQSKDFLMKAQKIRPVKYFKKGCTCLKEHIL
jgi:hypothetical protein